MLYVPILTSLRVVLSSNYIYQILWLISTFIAVALYLCLQGNIYIGLTYIIVYIGGVAMLFLFVIMLIYLRKHKTQINLVTLSLIITSLCVSLYLLWMGNDSYTTIHVDKIILTGKEEINNIFTYIYGFNSLSVIRLAIRLLLSRRAAIILCSI